MPILRDERLSYNLSFIRGKVKKRCQSVKRERLQEKRERERERGEKRENKKKKKDDEEASADAIDSTIVDTGLERTRPD